MNAYNIGPLTMQYVFRRAGLENMSDIQTVMDAVETALERYQRIIDSRPAINASLHMNYIKWSQSIYALDVADAFNETGKH